MIGNGFEFIIGIFIGIIFIIISLYIIFFLFISSSALFLYIYNWFVAKIKRIKLKHILIFWLIASLLYSFGITGKNPFDLKNSLFFGLLITWLIDKIILQRLSI